MFLTKINEFEEMCTTEEKPKIQNDRFLYQSKKKIRYIDER